MASTTGVRKTLFIGCGGSGGTTLRYLHRELLNGLLDQGWTGPLPECWQFLLMDVAGDADGVQGNVPNVLIGGASFMGLADAQTTWSTFLDMMPRQEPEVLAGWRPEAPLPGEPVEGAGQRRALGRLVAMTRLSEIKDRIDGLIQKLNSADQALQAVAKCLETGAKFGSEEVRVYLVTSLGGGSGSGMFLDVSTVLQTMGKVKHCNVMFAPDVFDGLVRDGGNKGIVPNTLAAVSELLNAFEGNEGYSDADKAMLRRAQIAIGKEKEGQRTTASNLIISRRGEGSDFEKQNDVYHAAARALAAITLDGDLNEEIEHYAFQNSETLKPAEKYNSLKRLKTAASTREELASSIGMASISTGRGAFGQYAAERLTRYIKEKICDNEKNVADLINKDLSQFQNLSRQFANRVGLNVERGQPNQIVQALTGVNGDTIISTLANIEKEVVAQIREPLNSGKLGVTEVQNIVQQNYDGLIEKHRSQFSATLKGGAVSWMYQVQARLLDETVSSVVQNGMLLTTEFLKQLRSDLESSVTNLNADRITFEAEYKKYFESARQAFANVGKKLKLAIDATEVKQSLSAHHNRTDRQLRMGVYSVASELTKDFLTGVLDPLISELVISRQRFINGINASQAAREQIDGLAEKETPPHLMPAKNVIFLDSPDDFDSMFETQLRSVYRSPATDDNIALAAREILANVWPGKVSDENLPTEFELKYPLFANQQFISTKSLWKTSAPRVLDPDESPTRGSYTAKRFSVDDLLGTARNWQRSRSVLSEFTNCKMKHYIYPKNERDRTQEFLSALERALAMSGVMAEMDQDAIQKYTGNKLKPTFQSISNGIPLRLSDTGSDLTPEAKAAIDIMMERGFREEEARGLIGKGGEKPAIQVFTIISEKTPPTFFKSIGEPIRQRLAAIIGDNNLREDFYELRRARPLPSFIPAANEVVVRMIYGWTVARALGLIPPTDIDEFVASDGHSTIRIFDPMAPAENGHYYNFPNTVLRGARNMATTFGEGEVLPSLLESMILGYAAINSGWLDSYARLAELGTRPDVLTNWLKTGEIKGANEASPALSPFESLKGLETRRERVEKFVKHIDERIKFNETLIEKSYALDDIGEADREWELRVQIEAALKKLKEDATKADSTQGPPR